METFEYRSIRDVLGRSFVVEVFGELRFCGFEFTFFVRCSFDSVVFI